jgi:lipid-A-disaccharide synthase
LTAEPKKILIVTGEASGDLHGSRVAKALQGLSSDVRIFAMGGEELRLAGAEILVHSTPLAVVGITEVLGRMGAILRAYRELKAFIRHQKPALLILIDFPDFNLRLARAAKNHGIPVLYYISPQVWAWRAGRVKTMAPYVQKMAVIFPFEVPLYERAGIPVEFVGHPLMDVLLSWEEGQKMEGRGTFAGAPLIALLPGSREKEISSLLPEMARAADLLLREKPQARFILPLASTIRREDVEKYLPIQIPALTIVEGKTYEAVRAAEMAIVASGTATLEAAILGRPMVIVYRVSPLSYWIGRALIHLDCIGLVNIVAQRKIVPEILQGDVSGEKISAAALRILNEAEYRETIIAGLKEVRTKMGGRGAADRVAQIALKMAQGL